MGDPAPRQATYEDVLAAPAHQVAEIVAGELRLSPRPSGPHAAAASALGEELGPPFKRGRNGPGGWIILFEPEVHLAADIVVPDLGGWRRTRLPAVPNAPFFTLAPDWVCEVLSPGGAKTDRADKLPIYAREGVVHVWLVHPLEHTLECLRLEGSRYTILGVWRDAARLRAAPFEAIELDLALLWADVEREPGR